MLPLDTLLQTFQVVHITLKFLADNRLPHALAVSDMQQCRVQRSLLLPLVHAQLLIHLPAYIYLLVKVTCSKALAVFYASTCGAIYCRLCCLAMTSNYSFDLLHRLLSVRNTNILVPVSGARPQLACTKPNQNTLHSGLSSHDSHSL